MIHDEIIPDRAGAGGPKQPAGRRRRTAVSAFVVAGLILLTVGCTSAVQAGPGEARPLESRLQTIAQGTDGELGVCAKLPDGALACVNGDQRYSMQSVMKLIVGAAVMDAADRGVLQLDDRVVLTRKDLSLHVQPLARIVRETGEFRTTIGDLVERAVVESDSAATDFLYARLGGAPAINDFLDRAGASPGIRVDRDERHLQTEISGVTWRPDFVELGRLDAARAALSEQQKRTAFEAYLVDDRDTATPRAMAVFLGRLAGGDLLSDESTRHFLGVMRRTRTFPTRLRAGVPETWQVAHKTGTSDDFDGLNAVTNDVGLLIAPDGAVIPIAAFLARSRQDSTRRDATIAAAARAVVAAHTGDAEGD